MHKSSTSRLERIEIEPWCPRWWQYYPAATIMSLWNSFLPHCPYTVIPWTYFRTQRYMTKYCISPPVAMFAHYTHYKQFHSCCYMCIFQHERRWCEIMPLMTHFKHSVQWPRTSTNVNDALSVSRHHLAKGEPHYSVRTEALVFPLSVLASNIITLRDWLCWSR